MIAVLPATASSACGGEDAAVTLTPAPDVAGSPTPSTATATPSPSGPASIVCAAQGAAGDPLTAFGAGFTAWVSHHQVDSRRPDFFLPYLNDGLDRYTQVLCTPAGRVVSYHLNFTPLISLAAARLAFRAQLPGDATLVYDTVQSGCEHIQYRSSLLARALGQDDADGVADAALILPEDPSQPAAIGTIFLDARVSLDQTPTVC